MVNWWKRNRRKEREALTIYKRARAIPVRVLATAWPSFPTISWSWISILLLRLKKIDFHFLNALRLSTTAKIKEVLQLSWSHTSIGKTPKTLWKKWGKSVVFNRKCKYKNKWVPNAFSFHYSYSIFLSIMRRRCIKLIN